MAWALTLGSARSLSIDTPFYLPTNCDLEIDMAWNAISSNYEMIFGTWADGGEGTSKGVWYFGKYIGTDGRLTIYNRQNGARNKSLANEIVVDQYVKFTLERRGNSIRVLADGAEVVAPITFADGDLDIYPIRCISKSNNSEEYHADVSVKSATLKNIDTATTINLWDATASDHSNTGVQPALLDTVGGNNATGVGFPTDGSAWVDLGGDVSSLTFDLDYRNSISNAQVSDVDYRASVLSASLSDFDVRSKIYNSVISELDIRNKTLGAAFRSIDLRSKIFNAAYADLDIRDEILAQAQSNSVITDLDIRNSLSNAALADLTIQSKILQATLVDVDFRNKVLQAITRDIDISNKVYQFTTSDTDIRNKVYGLVYSDLIIRNSVDGVRSSESVIEKFTFSFHQDSFAIDSSQNDSFKITEHTQNFTLRN